MGGGAYCTYDPVEASAAMPMMMAEAAGSPGGGGAAGLSVYLSYTFDGGLSNTGSWDLGGKRVQKVDGDVAATNANLAAVMKETHPLTVLSHTCATFG